MRSARAISALVAVALMSLVSCVDDDGTAGSTPTQPAPATSEVPAPTTTSAEVPSTEGLGLVTADGSELTAEQEQMWGMLEQYVDELRNGDYEAAESWVFDDGGIRVLDGFDIPYGEFETMLPDAPWLIDEMLDTALVYEDHIVFFHRDVTGLVRSNDVRFGDFDNGEFHIEEHRITD